MIMVLLQFLLSALAIVTAGTVLTRSADRLAELTGLGRLFVGSVFLAAATSLPELMVDISAVRMGMPNLAVGDLLGSSLYNLLILGVADLLQTRRGFLFSRAAVHHALSATQSILMTALAAAGILLAPQVSKWAPAGMSYGTLAILVTYLFGLRLVFVDQRSAPERIAAPVAQGTGKSRNLRKALVRPVTGYFGGAIAIMIAAPYMAEAAGSLATITGLGGTFIGTSLVALCTSLPELVSTLAAVRLGAFDLALGNIFGSNAFNMVLLVPLDFVSDGPLLAQVSQSHLLTALGTIIITTVAIMGQLYQVEKRISFLEPDALMVIALVLTTLTGIYLLG